MSSPASATALYLEPRPSRRLQQLLGLGHWASALLVWALPLAFHWQLATMPLLLLSYRHVRRCCAAMPRLARESDGTWLWHRADGAVVPVRLLPDTLLTPWLVVLNVREAGTGRRHSLVLLWDSLAPEQFRALRVALRLERV